MAQEPGKPPLASISILLPAVANIAEAEDSENMDSVSAKPSLPDELLLDNPTLSPPNYLPPAVPVRGSGRVPTLSSPWQQPRAPSTAPSPLTPPTCDLPDGRITQDSENNNNTKKGSKGPNSTDCRKLCKEEHTIPYTVTTTQGCQPSAVHMEAANRVPAKMSISSSTPDSIDHVLYLREMNQLQTILLSFT